MGAALYCSALVALSTWLVFHVRRANVAMKCCVPLVGFFFCLSGESLSPLPFGRGGRWRDMEAGKEQEKNRGASIHPSLGVMTGSTSKARNVPCADLKCRGEERWYGLMSQHHFLTCRPSLYFYSVVCALDVVWELTDRYGWLNCCDKK